MNCSIPATVNVIAPGYAGQTCPTGYHWNGNQCMPNQQSCPSGQYWNGSICVPTKPPCPSGYYWDGYECVPYVIPCPTGYYFDGTKCVINTAKQNMTAWDCTGSVNNLNPGCFVACWSGTPAGTTELQLWHVNPANGQGIELMMAGIPPQSTQVIMCGYMMVPGATQHWNIRALAGNTLIGYSNVVGSVTTV